jgi:hypothetical protein
MAPSPNPPSIARRASVIAVAILATAAAAVAVIGYYLLWEVYINHSEDTLRQILLRDLRSVPAFIASLCVATMVASPLLLRVARIVRLSHAALLSAVATGAAWGVFRSERVDFVETFANRIMPANFDLPSTFIVTFPLLQIVHIALGCFLYHTGRRYFRSAPPSPPSTALAPAPGSGSRFGTRGEIRTFWLLISTIALFAGGIVLATRELLIEQIPPAIWKALEHGNEVTLLSFNATYPRTPKPTDFHERPIAGEVPVPAARDRAAIIACLKRCLASLVRFDKSPLSPEFGIRVKDGTATFDLLILPDSDRITIFEGDEPSVYVEMQGSPREIEALLRAAGANIPVPVRME